MLRLVVFALVALLVACGSGESLPIDTADGAGSDTAGGGTDDGDTTEPDDDTTEPDDDTTEPDDDTGGDDDTGDEDAVIDAVDDTAADGSDDDAAGDTDEEADTGEDAVDDADDAVETDAECVDGETTTFDVLCDDGRTVIAECACWEGMFECPNPCGVAPAACSHDSECPADQHCHPCGTSSCPGCTDCVPACVPHGCPTEPEPTCRMIRPECDEYAFAVVVDGCWQCVTPDSCSPMGTSDCEEAGATCHHAETCPDGTERIWSSCEPTGGICCRERAPASDCERAGAECVDGEACPTGTTRIRSSCEPTAGICCLRDRSCDDGSELVCDGRAPECTDFEIMALIDGCWLCVNPATCRPWGEPGCGTSGDCPEGEFCNSCGTSSCPVCLDCIPACTPVP